MNSKMLRFLEGKRIRLRALDPETDTPLLASWMNDESTRHFLGEKRAFPISLASEKQWVEKLAAKMPPEDIVFGIELKKGTCLIGVTGLHDIDWVTRKATTGTKIGPAELRSQGYGTEAKQLLLAYAFNTLNLNRIQCNIIVYNGASRRYCEKCGYHEEGVMRQAVYKNGQYHDLLMLAVLKDDWLATQAKPKKSKR